MGLWWYPRPPPPPCVAESSVQLVTSAPAVALTVGTTSKTAQQATPASATSIDGTACTKSDQKCENNERYICNYVSNNAGGLGKCLLKVD